jgi:hypothetical protein
MTPIIAPQNRHTDVEFLADVLEEGREN